MSNMNMNNQIDIKEAIYRRKYLNKLETLKIKYESKPKGTEHPKYQLVIQQLNLYIQNPEKFWIWGATNF